MLQISARAHARAVSKTADTLGVPLPAGYLEQVAEVDAFEAAATKITVTTDQLLAAVLDAIEAGRENWPADKSIQQLAIRHQLTMQNIDISARQRADQMLAATLADWADELLTSWAGALDRHAQALVTAAEAGLNLQDTDAAIARGGEGMNQLHAAQVAVQSWAAATHAFNTLALVSGISLGGQSGVCALTPARLADLAPAYELARSERTDDLDAWLLTRCRIPLRLATLRQFMSRAAQFEADRQAEARARQEHRKERLAETW
jgi:hypothetical protein